MKRLQTDPIVEPLEGRLHLSRLTHFGTPLGFQARNATVGIMDLVHATTHALSSARALIGVATTGTKILFGGGYGGDGYDRGTVDIYDASAGRWSVTRLSQARQSIDAPPLGTQVCFAARPIRPPRPSPCA